MFEAVYSSKELSIEDYHAERDHESSSSLKEILRTPAHYLTSIGAPEKDSDAFLLGSAIHAAVLEPEVFAQKYAIIPKCDLRTTAGKAAFATFEAASEGKTLVQSKDAEYFDKIRSKIRAHKTAWKLLALPGEEESSIFWTDDETGIRLKVRPDKLILLGKTPVYISVKSTLNASKESFRRDIEKFRYDMAEAMYVDGIFQRYGVMPQQVWVVIEKATQEVCVFYPHREIYEQGYELYREALQRLKTCRETGNFYGYQPTGDWEEISLPPKSRYSAKKEAQPLALVA